MVSQVATHALVLKQMASLGVPTWRHDSVLPPAFPEEGDGVLVLHVWADTSDCGPDQIRMKKIIQTECEPRDDYLFFEADCFQHQDHLGIKAGCTVLD